MPFVAGSSQFFIKMVRYYKITNFFMKTIEFLKLFRDAFGYLVSQGVKMEDVRHIDMYDDFVWMRASGDKVTYIVSALSGRYNVSERTVYNVVARLGRECTPGAANWPDLIGAPRR